MSVWDRRKVILHSHGSVGEVSQNSLTPKCEVKGTECLFIYLFAYSGHDDIVYKWFLLLVRMQARNFCPVMDQPVMPVKPPRTIPVHQVKTFTNPNNKITQ